jgi:hypothetical protein
MASENNVEGRTFWDGIERERECQNRIHEEERKKCGVETYRKKRDVPEWDEVTVIRVGEIEVPDELHSFVQAEILDGEWGLTYPRWIQQCYIERMKQILNNPAEFGKIVLERRKRDHCIQSAVLEGCIDD